MLMPAWPANRVTGKSLAPSRSIAVRELECIDVDAEPGDGVRTGDTDGLKNKIVSTLRLWTSFWSDNGTRLVPAPLLQEPKIAT